MDIKAQIREESEKRFVIFDEWRLLDSHSRRRLINQVTNERQLFSLGAEWMLSQSSELKKENERLIEMAYIAGRNDEKSKSKSDTPYTDGWSNFKTENNL